MIYIIQNIATLSTISLYMVSISNGFLVSNDNSRLNDAEKSLREKITRDCQSQGIVIPNRALNEYASCFSHSHLLFAYKNEDGLPDYIPGNKTGELVEDVLEPWCVDWRKRTKCIADNSHFIRPCLSQEKTVLMDFNIAFGKALCSSDGDELYDVYTQFVSAGGIQCMLDQKAVIWQEMLSCMNPLNTARLKRNIFRVTDCMVQQLKRCPSELSMALLQVMVDISVPYYKSRGVYQLRVHDVDDESKDDPWYECTGKLRENRKDAEEDRIVKFLIGQSRNMYVHTYFAIAIGLCFWIIIALSCTIYHKEHRKENDEKNDIKNCKEQIKLKYKAIQSTV